MKIGTIINKIDNFWFSYKLKPRIFCRLYKLLSDNTFHQYLLYLILNPANIKNEFKKRSDWVQGQMPYLSHLFNKKQEVENYTLAGRTRIPNYVKNFQIKISGVIVLKDMMFDLPLAGRSIKVHMDEFDNLWTKQFFDSEDIESMHRFGWLLRLLVHRNKKNLSQAIMFGEKAIFSWINCHQKPDKNLWSWRSYTVSERIVNWLFFISLTEIDNSWDLQKQQLFIDSLVSQGNFLLHHLEYYGPDRTGNHLFKNGKALYILGSLLKLPLFQEAGRLIISNHYDNIFTKSGFFAEDSSHYHLLVTKWLMEILLIATVTNDDSMISWIKPKVASALKGVNSLLVKSDNNIHIPLIGDVSPDCSPEWLLGLQDVAINCFQIGNGSPINLKDVRGWHSLFNCFSGFKKPVMKNIESRNLYPEEGWVRLDKGIFTAFWHVNPEGSPKLPGHAHQDTGSFVLFSKGEPVFVDTGRSCYRNTRESRFGVSVYAHNNLIIDGKEPCPRFRLFYSKAFLKNFKKKLGTPCIRKEVYIDKQVVVICHGGYRRIKGCGDVIRQFKFSEDNLTIENNLDGEGKHRVELVFHAPLEVSHSTTESAEFVLKTVDSLQKFKLKIQGHGLKDIKMISGSPEFTFGWWYPKYGQPELLTSIIATFESMLPWKGNVFLSPVSQHLAI